MPDSITTAVQADLQRRSELDINKYGKTLDRTDLSLRHWLQHAYEENLDLCNYLKRCIVEIDDNEITKMMIQEPTPKQHTDWITKGIIKATE